MEEQNSMLPPRTAIRQVGGVVDSKEKKMEYVPPKMGSIIVELENSIASGSITLKESDEMVEESWMVEEDVVKDIEVDLF